MKLYCCNINELNSLDGVRLLTDERRVRIERYALHGDKMRCLAAGLLLRFAFGKKHFDIKCAPSGKPYLESGPFFNLSHSGDCAVLGVCRNELGVDVEKISQFPFSVAKRMFADIDSSEDNTLLYKLWTAKESIAKATGKGIFAGDERLSASVISEGSYTADGVTWFLKWSELDGHMLCTACKTDEPVEIICVSPELLLQ